MTFRADDFTGVLSIEHKLGILCPERQISHDSVTTSESILFHVLYHCNTINVFIN